MWFFNISLILGLVTFFWFFLHARLHFNTKVISGTFAIILLYRIVSYITIYFYGDTSWWQHVYSDKTNHYEIGILILVVVFLFKKYMKRDTLATLLGIASGLIIDETSDILKLIPFVHLPYHFRDSLGDLFVIVCTYIIFVLSVYQLKIGEKNTPKNLKSKERF